MTGLSSVIDLMQNTTLSEEQKELIAIMSCSLQVITRLVNDILLFSKVRPFPRFTCTCNWLFTCLWCTSLLHTQIEAGGFALIPQAVDFPRFMGAFLEAISKLMHSKELAFTVDIDPALPRGLYMDADRFAQILGNLLHNAIKVRSFCALVLLRPNTDRVAMCCSSPGDGERSRSS